MINLGDKLQLSKGETVTILINNVSGAEDYDYAFWVLEDCTINHPIDINELVVRTELRFKSTPKRRMFPFTSK